MVHEQYLKNASIEWRPSYVRNQRSFADRIAHYRRAWSATRKGSAERNAVVRNFNREYNAWISRVHNENRQRRRSETEFLAEIRRARRQGPAAEAAVLATFNTANAARRQAAKPMPRARKPAPRRSGAPRNTGNLRRQMARQTLTRSRTNLGARKANLVRRRNALERNIENLVNQLRQDPNTLRKRNLENQRNNIQDELARINSRLASSNITRRQANLERQRNNLEREIRQINSEIGRLPN